MNGNIYVQSEVGKGTIFSFDIWVELPEEDCDCGENMSEAKYNGAIALIESGDYEAAYHALLQKNALLDAFRQ